MDFRNRLGSLRWGSSDGDSVGSEALYQPYGVIWYQCDESSFADFDPYCYCYVPVAVGPDGRPYIPGWGRWMTPRRYGAFDPDNLNAYAYGGNDPINNVDSGGSGPHQPPLPGQDQRLNSQVKQLQEGFEKLMKIDEAIEPISARVMPAAGMMTAGTWVAVTAADATVAAPWAFPATVPVAAAGAAMAVEGLDYLVTGNFTLANWAVSHF